MSFSSKSGSGGILTPAERDFMLGYWYEIYEFTPGLALAWLKENKVGSMILMYLEQILNRELGLDGSTRIPPKPESYSVPWASLDELIQRNIELKPILEKIQAEEKLDGR